MPFALDTGTINLLTVITIPLLDVNETSTFTCVSESVCPGTRYHAQLKTCLPFGHMLILIYHTIFGVFMKILSLYIHRTNVWQL